VGRSRGGLFAGLEVMRRSRRDGAALPATHYAMLLDACIKVAPRPASGPTPPPALPRPDSLVPRPHVRAPYASPPYQSFALAPHASRIRSPPAHVFAARPASCSPRPLPGPQAAGPCSRRRLIARVCLRARACTGVCMRECAGGAPGQQRGGGAGRGRARRHAAGACLPSRRMPPSPLTPAPPPSPPSSLFRARNAAPPPPVVALWNFAGPAKDGESWVRLTRPWQSTADAFSCRMYARR
jgi:hypothetical protein